MIFRSKKQKGETVLRLLIAILEEKKALEVRLRLYGMDERWDICVAADGAQAALLLKTERWDALLLDSRLRADGASLWETLCQAPPLCPPRVLALWQDGPRPAADCAVPAESGGVRIAALLSVLAKKPLPCLAAAHRARTQRAAERFLDALGMRREWKGRRYAAWCLCRRVPVPGLDQQPVNRLYAECARAFGVSAGFCVVTSGWPWRACSPWAAFPKSSVSSARPSTRTRASPPTGPF